MPRKKKPQAPQGSDPFANSRRILGNLIETMGSDEACHQGLSEIESALSSKGQELMAQIKADFYARKKSADLSD